MNCLQTGQSAQPESSLKLQAHWSVVCVLLSCLEGYQCTPVFIWQVGGVVEQPFDVSPADLSALAFQLCVALWSERQKRTSWTAEEGRAAVPAQSYTSNVNQPDLQVLRAVTLAYWNVIKRSFNLQIVLSTEATCFSDAGLLFPSEIQKGLCCLWAQ